MFVFLPLSRRCLVCECHFEKHHVCSTLESELDWSLTNKPLRDKAHSQEDALILRVEFSRSELSLLGSQSLLQLMSNCAILPEKVYYWSIRLYHLDRSGLAG